MTDEMSSTDPTRAARDLISSLLELLACPDCRGSLSETEGSLVCDGCARMFAVTNGIPQLLPMVLAAGSPTDPAWRTWAGALDRLVAWRRRTWDGGKSGTALQGRVRAIQATFAEHSRLAEAHGLVLDVGCGSAEIATTLGNECRYVGVDPLPLATPSGPPLVRGVGERLPFHAETFDLVLVLETLDHCQSPARLLAEVCRVLTPNGILCVEQYLSRPDWRERLRRWWEGSAGPRPAPCDGSKVVLLDESDVLGLIREAFAEVQVGVAPGGSHLFARAGRKRQASGGGDMATLVSAIIPTFNRAALVGEAIESLLRQTYPACEIVVVDDGSMDETPAVLAQFGARIRTIRTSNRGCAAARNTGIDLARGAYLAFVDSDDAAPPDKLALQAPVLDRHPEVGFVYGPSVAFGAELPCDQLLLPVQPDAEGSVAEGLFMTTRIGFDSVLLRREAVEHAGGFDESLLHNEDTDLLLRAALDWKAVCLDVPTGRHRWHSGRKSRDEAALRRAVLASMERVLAARPEFRERLGKRAAHRLAEVRREISRALAARGEVAAARVEATTAWQLHPSAALAVWEIMLRIPPLVPMFLWSGRFLARSVGFVRARLPRR